MLPALPATGGDTSRVLERYLQVCVFLVLLSAFGALASTGQLDAFSIFIVSAALLARGILLARDRAWHLSDGWATALTVACIVFYAADLVLISRAFVTATVHLVIFGLVVKLFAKQRNRDHLLLALLAFAMILGAAVLTVQSGFLLTFSVFLLVALPAFMLMEMRRSAGSATVASAGPTRADRPLARTLAALSPALLLFILLAGTGIFFLLPRVSAGYLSAYRPGSDLSTGFSDTVELGRIGEIQQSQSLVMHVQVEGDTTGVHELRFRGVSLAAFDGHTWSNSSAQIILPRTPDGRFIVTPPQARWQKLSHSASPPRSIAYRVLLEPLNSNVFFLPDRPLLLSGNYGLVTMDQGGAVYNVDRERSIALYDGNSDLSRPAPEMLRSTTGTVPAPLAQYLQLPALDPRIPELARRITASAINDYDRAATIEQYLTRQFGYTLQQPQPPPKDPLAYFLFERKQGHCEYFASSMAVMLRSLGIPTRVVNGFRGGQFNDLTGQYMIRASDAHSWVEVWFPQYGWTTFDPTPAGGVPTATDWSRWKLYADAASSFWREWVVNYDASHQQNLGEQAVRNSRRLVEQTRQNWHARYEHLLRLARRTRNVVVRYPGLWISGALALLLGVLLIAQRRHLQLGLQRRRLLQHPQSAPRLAATVWYERMTSALGRRGWRKTPAQTPAEFVHSIPISHLHDSVGRFTRHYERARFDESTEDASKLPELYEEVAVHARQPEAQSR